MTAWNALTISGITMVPSATSRQFALDVILVRELGLRTSSVRCARRARGPAVVAVGDVREGGDAAPGERAIRRAQEGVRRGPSIGIESK